MAAFLVNALKMRSAREGGGSNEEARLGDWRMLISSAVVGGEGGGAAIAATPAGSSCRELRLAAMDEDKTSMSTEKGATRRLEKK